MARAEIGRSGNIAGALKHYRLDVGKYPETDDGLLALSERPSHIDEDSKIWQGPYLETPPNELLDPWGEPFIYASPGKYNEDGYDLSSKGPDREEDTEDDIKNWTEN
jgi:general secretion pathway protein G